uniref:RNA polymerase III subunit C6 n=1 Tax=Kalmanozyma brasiliensis (strain GHG001) TaxID=1365824 RepID=V5EPR6_KALBG
MPSAKASSSSSAAGSKLTKLETALYRAAQSAPGGIITQDQISEQFKHEQIDDRLQAINGLLRKNLFTAQSLQGTIQFAATARAEASIMGKLDENETMVYSHIKDARNDGIWTKQLKNRTNLHQTIINRCLKSLEQKQLVKAVKSVKYPTRKIYMLFGLTPSIELSGGPWYTDNELDTGFINELSMAILNFIRSKSFPKNGQSRALFPTSHTSQLPSAKAIHSYLRNAELTETQLEVEHVVSLLDILVYDEQIEKIPVLSLNGGGGGINEFDEEDQNYSDSERSTDGSGSDSESASGSDSESSAQETGSDKGHGKKKIKKERKVDDDEDDDSDDENAGPVKSGKRKSGSKAIRPHSVKVRWTETPCGHCPVFDFCDDTGPVNAETCEYFGGKEDELGRKVKNGWIDTIAFDDDEEEPEEADEGDDVKMVDDA